ncbi:hypothetical protein ACQEU5_24315 [Marinactinospora thermotolerans]|uniref:Uncharacterized protein n=1 Tax=Marinactinospora thermotolerans DSM 45154 TaxID=1122192 RepID=A0A1T4KDX4_9ACTN|nr:hypothetical protein [Marinactinospora thermotolerans]SJZ40658.1 hypothetical protein SAMN02745673_00330 [Marinactinospora thermotolerans DSM 45154]
MHSERDTRTAPDDVEASRREARWNFRRSEKRRSAHEASAGDQRADDTMVGFVDTHPDDHDTASTGEHADTTTRLSRDPAVAASTDSGRVPAPRTAAARGGAGSSPAATGGEDYRTRWRELQGDFVDDPQRAVREADRLVGHAVEELTAALNEHRRALERRWSGDGATADTEELRQALRGYRGLLERLVAANGPTSGL